ncbi:hypothetical protein [Collinsella sp. An7]|uniref:hypothetical protein n=1 Tax=Collinsella sp. An7 TaxID=1965651 RepID=UPI00117D92BA|nr:hypothetical protein [Collinsella sp. An7]
MGPTPAVVASGLAALPRRQRGVPAAAVAQPYGKKRPCRALGMGEGVRAGACRIGAGWGRLYRADTCMMHPEPDANLTPGGSIVCPQVPRPKRGSGLAAAVARGAPSGL